MNISNSNLNPEKLRDLVINAGIEGSTKTANLISSQGEAIKLASDKMAETVLEEGKNKAESLGYFLGNMTKNVQDTSKSAVMIHSGRRAAKNGFKATMDFHRGDPVCGTLCTVSSCCEVVSGVIVWVPFPGKIVTVASLKSVSAFCEMLRDMCVANPTATGC